MIRAAGLLSVLVAALWAGIAAGPAGAQQGDPAAGVVVPEAVIDFAAWDQLARQVEQVLAVDAASDAALSALRAQVVTWRERFLAGSDANAGRIATAQERLAALPPPPDPESGVPEAEIVTETRNRLQTELETLEGPRLRARLAFPHADGLVRQIDSELRSRQASTLSQRLPAPLNPLNWEAPLAEAASALARLPGQVTEAFATKSGRREIIQGLPVAGVLVLTGVVLLLRSGRWTHRMLEAGMTIERRSLRLAVESLGLVLQLTLPLAGLLAVLAGISISGALGETGSALVEGLAAGAVVAILGAWAVARVYPDNRGRIEGPLRVLSEPSARRARRQARVLVAMFALRTVVEVDAPKLDLSQQTIGYMVLPLVVIAGAALFRLAHIYRHANLEPVQNLAASDEEGPNSRLFFARVVGFLSVLTRALAAVAVAAALMGYVNAAVQAVFASAMSFLFGGLLTQAQRLVQRSVAIFQGNKPDAEPGLVALLASWSLSLVALPGLAIVWGARPTDLSEIWAQVRTGFTMGDVTLRPGSLISLVVVFTLAVMVTRFIQGLLSQTILPKTTLDIGAQRAVTSGLGYVGITLSGLLAVTAAGLNLSSLAIVAGALSVGIGFGLQAIVSNFVSGIILLIERPVAEGDWIEVGGQMGIVKGISVRSTRIETFDRIDVIVPNSDLISNSVTNWTRGNLMGRVIIPVSVIRGTDSRLVDRVLREIAEAHPMVAIRPEPLILFMGFGEGTLNFEIRAILRDVNFILDVRSDINHEIARRFAEEGIEIPFPQRDLRVRTDGVEITSSGVPVPMPARTPHSSRGMLDPGDFGGDGAR